MATAELPHLIPRRERQVERSQRGCKGILRAVLESLDVLAGSDGDIELLGDTRQGASQGEHGEVLARAAVGAYGWRSQQSRRPKAI